MKPSDTERKSGFGQSRRDFMTVAVDFIPRMLDRGFRVAERRLKAGLKP